VCGLVGSLEAAGDVVVVASRVSSRLQAAPFNEPLAFSLPPASSSVVTGVLPTSMPVTLYTLPDIAEIFHTLLPSSELVVVQVPGKWLPPPTAAPQRQREDHDQDDQHRQSYEAPPTDGRLADGPFGGAPRYTLLGGRPRRGDEGVVFKVRLSGSPALPSRVVAVRLQPLLRHEDAQTLEEHVETHFANSRTIRMMMKMTSSTQRLPCGLSWAVPEGSSVGSSGGCDAGAFS